MPTRRRKAKRRSRGLGVLKHERVSKYSQRNRMREVKIRVSVKRDPYGEKYDATACIGNRCGQDANAKVPTLAVKRAVRNLLKKTWIPQRRSGASTFTQRKWR